LKSILLCLLFSLLFTSCVNPGISWSPDFYMADPEHNGIVNERGIFVDASSDQFAGYACLSQAKIKELAEILAKARMPNGQKKMVTDQIDKAIWWAQ